MIFLPSGCSSLKDLLILTTETGDVNRTFFVSPRNFVLNESSSFSSSFNRFTTDHFLTQTRFTQNQTAKKAVSYQTTLPLTVPWAISWEYRAATKSHARVVPIKKKFVRLLSM
jgi:hypothetical protein